MAKQIIAETYRVAIGRDGLLILEITASMGRVYQFVMHPTAAEPMAASLLESVRSTPIALSVAAKSPGFQSRKRAPQAATARQMLDDLPRVNGSVIGIDPVGKRVWASFGIPGGEVLDIFLAPEDVREMFEHMNRAILALAADTSGAKH